MKFHFRAEPLLHLRRQQLETARGELARANLHLAQATHALGEAREAVTRAESGFATALEEGVDGFAIERHRNWIVLQRNSVSLRHAAREACQIKANQAAAVVMDRRRQVRVLERLRERAWRRHAEQERRREMKDIDMLATLQYARRAVEGGIDSER